MLRGILRTLGTFYFDDLTVQDWQTTASACQRSVQRVCALLGYPFADEKQRSDFLSLIHDLTRLRPDSAVRLWIRDRLIEKVRSPVSTARRAQSLSPGQAGKLYGCLTFLDQGAFGRIARAGLNALRERGGDRTAGTVPTFVGLSAPARRPPPRPPVALQAAGGF